LLPSCCVFDTWGAARVHLRPFAFVVVHSHSLLFVRVRCCPFAFVVVRSRSLLSVRVRCRPFAFAVVRSSSFIVRFVHWCRQSGQKGGSGGYDMDCQGTGYSLGYFPSLFMGIGHCVYVAFTFRWPGNDRDSPVVFGFVLALGSRTGFPLRRFMYAHIPRPRNGRGELLAFAFAGIVLAVVLVVFTFGVAFVVFGIRSCLRSCLVRGGDGVGLYRFRGVHGPGGTQ